MQDFISYRRRGMRQAVFFGGRDAVVEARQERRKLSFLNSCRQNLYQSHDTKAESLEDVFKTAWSIQV